MYMHAHLRWAQALAHLGDAEAAFHALRQANPVGLREVVPNARLRQANCYTSSSDADFADRADATARYDAVRIGRRRRRGAAGASTPAARASPCGSCASACWACACGARRCASTRCCRGRSMGWSRASSWRIARLRCAIESARSGTGPERVTCNGRPLAFDREPQPVPNRRRRDSDGRAARAPARRRATTSRSRWAEMTEDRDSLDDFRDISGWSAVASGQAQLTLGVRRRPGRDRQRCDSTTTSRAAAASSWRARTLRARCRRRGRCRCACAARRPRTSSRSSSSDPSGRNVWWWHRDAFDFPADWQPLRIRSSEVAFAWGPAGGGTMHELGALEIAIAAGPGGRGTVSVCDLRFEDLSLARAAARRRFERGPGARAGARPPGLAGDELAQRGRRVARVARARLRPRARVRRSRRSTGRPPAPPAPSKCSAPTTAPRGRRSRPRRQAEGERSYVYLPGGGCSRHLRLFLHEPPAGGGPA